MRSRFSLGPIEQLADDEVIGVAATSNLARDGDIWNVSGIDLANFCENPVILAGHDPSAVVGSAIAIGLVDPHTLGVRIKFAPPGASAIADSTRLLVKSGVLKGLSCGVDPRVWEPVDPREPFGAQRLVSSELLEISVVSIPADTGAVVTARAHRSLSALTPVSGSAVRRMLRICGELAPPPAARPPSEHFREHRAHTMAAAAACQRQFDDHRQRQAELARLAAAAPPEAIQKQRRRTRWRRPFGL